MNKEYSQFDVFNRKSEKFPPQMILTEPESFVYMVALASLSWLVQKQRAVPKEIVNAQKNIYKAVALGIIAPEAIVNMTQKGALPSDFAQPAELDKQGDDYYYDPNELGWRE